jgi:hypothetical protein
MPIFAIDTVTTYVGHEPGEVGGRTVRIIEVKGPAEGGGGNRARFIFSGAVDPRRTAPVGYVTAVGETGLDLVGWLPAADYAAYHDILESGGPLQVHFETRDRTTGYLRRLALGRANATLVAAAPGELVIARPTAPRRPHLAFAMPL